MAQDCIISIPHQTTFNDYIAYYAYDSYSVYNLETKETPREYKNVHFNECIQEKLNLDWHTDFNVLSGRKRHRPNELAELLAKKKFKSDGRSSNERPTTLSHVPSRRRGILVLDIDRTLVHTTDTTLHPCAQNYYDGDPNTYRKGNLIIRLRPNVREFLYRVQFAFDIYLYTIACRSYAMDIISIIDESLKVLSPQRLICRDNPSAPINEKNLLSLGSLSSLGSPIPDIADLLAIKDFPIFIIDDLLFGWREKDQPRVDAIKPFVYFMEYPQEMFKLNCPCANPNLSRCYLRIVNPQCDLQDFSLLEYTTKMLHKVKQGYQPLAGKTILFAVYEDASCPSFPIKIKRLKQAIKEADAQGAGTHWYLNTKSLSAKEFNEHRITHVFTYDKDLFQFDVTNLNHPVEFVSPLSVLDDTDYLDDCLFDDSLFYNNDQNASPCKCELCTILDKYIQDRKKQCKRRASWSHDASHDTTMQRTPTPVRKHILATSHDTNILSRQPTPTPITYRKHILPRPSLPRSSLLIRSQSALPHFQLP